MKTGSEGAKTLTDDNFNTEVLESDAPVLVDFYADWCGPCQAMAPVLEQLAKDYAGRAVVGKLDVDANPSTAARYGVRSIPTLLFVKDGAVVDQIVGASPKRALAQKLDALLAS